MVITNHKTAVGALSYLPTVDNVSLLGHFFLRAFKPIMRAEGEYRH